MKELTIEQKAQRYDEAIEVAKKINNERRAQPFDVITRVFPELKESEGERIRELLIEAVIQVLQDQYCSNRGVPKEKVVAWLEKQQKPVISDDALREGIAHFGITQYQIDNWLKKYVDVEKQGGQKPIWHNEDEEPQRGSLILLIMQSGTPIVAKIIEPNHTFNHGERWAYIDDLLERQGEQSKEAAYTHKVETGNGNIKALVTENVQLPKFKVGDIIKNKKNGDTVKVEQILSDSYCYSGWDGAATIHSDFLISDQGNWELVEQKPADKVEPKFHEGEWITNGDYTWKIVEVKPLDYILQSQDGNIVDDTIFHVDEQFHSFDIEDAKDGDVLFCKGNIKNSNGIKYERICLFNNLDNAFFTLTKTSNFVEEYDIDVNIDYPDNTVPATKKQKEILFMSMKDAGYSFDFEKKELKKIEQKPIENKGMNLKEEEMTPFQKEVFYIIDTTIEEEQGLKQVCDKLFALASNEIKQKFSWSEEDEGFRNLLIAIMKVEHPEGMFEANGITPFCGAVSVHRVIDWLKSLKAKVLSQPKQEWSALDERNLQGIIDEIEANKNHAPEHDLATYDRFLSWLKSLRLRNTWKPSDEQITWLYRASDDASKDSRMKQILNELLSDLKKLKE